MKQLCKYILALLCVFSACQSIEEVSKPEVFLEKDCMVELFTDIAFLKAAKTSAKKILEEKGVNPEAYILRKYNIDSVVFAENNKWYARHIEKYQEVFNAVKINLEKSKLTYEKLEKEEDSINKIEDSIKKVKVKLAEKLKKVKKQ